MRTLGRPNLSVSHLLAGAAAAAGAGVAAAAGVTWGSGVGGALLTTDPAFVQLPAQLKEKLATPRSPPPIPKEPFTLTKPFIDTPFAYPDCARPLTKKTPNGFGVSTSQISTSHLGIRAKPVNPHTRAFDAAAAQQHQQEEEDPVWTPHAGDCLRVRLPLLPAAGSLVDRLAGRAKTSQEGTC